MLLLHLHLVQIIVYCGRRGLAIRKLHCAARIVKVSLLRLQVDLQLRDLPLKTCNTKNASNMQQMAENVDDVLEDAQNLKKKLKMKLKLREIMEDVTAAQLTRGYMAEGMNALRADSIQKPKKRGRKTGRQVNAAAWSRIVKVARGEDSSGEEGGEKDNTAGPSTA
jgi:hypothetical protein